MPHTLRVPAWRRTGWLLPAVLKRIAAMTSSRNARQPLPQRLTRLAPLCAALLALPPLLAGAQTADPKELLRAAVSQQLRGLLGDGSGPVVERLMTVKIQPGLARNFDIGKVSSSLFGRQAATYAPDCRSTSTAAKEADEGLCVVEGGSRESETGAYTLLAYSKNIGAGNLMFARRAAFNPGSDALPPSAKLSDAQAYSQALKFMELLGVPMSEIPTAPAGVKNPLPVRSLEAGASDEKGNPVARVVVHKTVQLPRAVPVPGGLLQDPKTGVVLSHVMVPGAATFNVTDGGVQFARLDGWSDSPMDPKLDPRNAKKADELINEIVDDLYGEGVRKVGSLSILISLRRAYPNPDDPNPPLCPVCGVLRPALQVMVSQPGFGRVETSQTAFMAPGVVREYDLVHQLEGERPAR